MGTREVKLLAEVTQWVDTREGTPSLSEWDHALSPCLLSPTLFQRKVEVEVEWGLASQTGEIRRTMEQMEKPRPGKGRGPSKPCSGVKLGLVLCLDGALL